MLQLVVVKSNDPDILETSIYFFDCDPDEAAFLALNDSAEVIADPFVALTTAVSDDLRACIDLNFPYGS